MCQVLKEEAVVVQEAVEEEAGAAAGTMTGEEEAEAEDMEVEDADEEVIENGNLEEMSRTGIIPLQNMAN